MNDQFSPLGWYLRPETTPYWMWNATIDVPRRASDLWGQSTRSVAETLGGGLLGKLARPASTTEVLSDGLLGSFVQPVDNSSNSLLPATGSPREWTLSTFSHPFALPQPKPHLYDPVAALDAYCKQIRNKCIAECSNTALPSGDYGFLFWNCVNKCMQRYGCPTVRG